ncbi:sirohydrochlorin chelatase [Alicyclobacillus sp. ALC3]|uniref:sirohydrochlorin chelatase n=1 Tax=Alicyclobacillus sp. ALC3 TaxID=2796143 RepID=UPI002377D2D9|nr:CbiX/SirB N-terminal domain-containing protein [Alicyclobacillus sp. ALC3]WDL98741.1 hypothetical protein JC200_08825 [Alicyclobacillus sp. ALC3]
MITAIVLLSHGTRDTAGVSEFHRFCDEVNRVILARSPQFGLAPGELCVERAFLELCDPDVPTTLAACAEAGVERVVLVPLLLFEAGHAKQDIPGLIDQARRSGVHLPVDVVPPIGQDEVFIEVAAARVQAVVMAGDGQFAHAGARLPTGVQGHNVVANDGAALLFVGRGGTDPAARADALAVAAAVAAVVARTSGIGNWASAFLAGPGPDVHAAARELLARSSRLQRVVALPYLWFTGRLVRALHGQLLGALPDGVCLTMADHLGCHPGLVERVACRALAFAFGSGRPGQELVATTVRSKWDE